MNLADKIAETLKSELRLVITGGKDCEQCGEPVDYTCRVKEGCVEQCSESISKLVFDAMAAGDISIASEGQAGEANSDAGDRTTPLNRG